MFVYETVSSGFIGNWLILVAQKRPCVMNSDTNNQLYYNQLYNTLLKTNIIELNYNNLYRILNARDAIGLL